MHHVSDVDEVADLMSSQGVMAPSAACVVPDESLDLPLAEVEGVGDLSGALASDLEFVRCAGVQVDEPLADIALNLVEHVDALGQVGLDLDGFERFTNGSLIDIVDHD